MTRLTYTLYILICAGLFAACGGSSNSGMTVLPPALSENLSPVVDRMIPDRNLAVGRSADLDLVTPMRAFRDPEDAVLTYAAESSMPAVVTASASGNQLTISSVGPTGASDITVTATDPGGLSATQTFTVSVVTNTAPMATGTIPPLPISTGASQGISMSLYFTDRENDALIYGATSSDNAVATVRASGIGVVVAAVSAGTADITVTASDPDRLSAMQMFTVTVTASNGNRPRITPPAISTQTFNTNSPRNIDLSAHFSGGRGTLTYTATSLDSNIATASVDGSVMTIQPVARGQTSITATATDADMNSASQAFDVMINSMTPPPSMPGTVTVTMMILNHLFLETEPGTVRINLNNHFGDSQGAALTYSASVSGSAISAGVSGNTLSITQVQGVRAGEVTITVRAMNSSGGSAEQNFMARTTGIGDHARYNFGPRFNNYSIPDNYMDAYMFGNISNASDGDVVRVNLSPGVSYEIYLEGLSTNAGTLEYPVLELLLWDNERRIAIDSSEGGENAQLRYTPPDSAVPVNYVLRMGTRFGGTGIYRLQITSP